MHRRLEPRGGAILSRNCDKWKTKWADILNKKTRRRAELHICSSRDDDYFHCEIPHALYASVRGENSYSAAELKTAENEM